jgi:hypothetical protein
MIDTVTLGGGHLDPASYPDTLMTPFVRPSVRRSQSAIDILAAAEKTGFFNLNLNPLAAPLAFAEPAPLAVVGLGLLAAIALCGRRSSDKVQAAA